MRSLIKTRKGSGGCQILITVVTSKLEYIPSDTIGPEEVGRLETKGK
ncbi:MAG: hypothetical protein QHH00_07350 [Methanomassiliicoccales archaeon]|nr:hypothetical protein [Methanomassiliicoccales archaeon]